ncbi:hypothetical protein CGCVW01_v008088 [Colletotrichum viniferum]|nr:hypothetical protein CGCVW01_v008088 [Colletotrichum viniferum]
MARHERRIGSRTFGLATETRGNVAEVPIKPTLAAQQPHRLGKRINTTNTIGRKDPLTSTLPISQNNNLHRISCLTCNLCDPRLTLSPNITFSHRPDPYIHHISPPTSAGSQTKRRQY